MADWPVISATGPWHFLQNGPSLPSVAASASATFAEIERVFERARMHRLTPLATRSPWQGQLCAPGNAAAGAVLGATGTGAAIAVDANSAISRQLSSTLS